MYNKIKRTVTTFIPKKLLFKFEPVFRFIPYFFYKGETFQCNICNKKLKGFIHFDKEDKLCPYCGSISRNHRLWNILNSEFPNDKMQILDFSPSRSIYRSFKKNSSVSCTSTDLSCDFLVDRKYDITNIVSQNETYDLIICYHILEHVENDSKAINELYRILKPGGRCIIQTPFKEGNTYEDLSIKSEEDRLKNFGQKDHVRIYSVTGLKERLSDCGFTVNIREYTETVDNKFGYKKREFVLICGK